MRMAEAHPQWLVEAREHEHTPKTLEYGISSFVFRTKRPFPPERLHAALSSRPLPGALAGLLRLKGFVWLATRPNQQFQAALAGTQFEISHGAPWWAIIPRHLWPDGLDEAFQASDGNWDAEHGDRRTELVCIGRDLDHAAGRAQLEACLLTKKEMVSGEESWLALADPWNEATEEGGEQEGGEHGEREEHEPLSGVTEASLREMMRRASEQVSPRYLPALALYGLWVFMS